MTDLLAENVALRKQNLQLMIQSAIITQQMQACLIKTNESVLFIKSFSEGVNDVVNKLAKKIPNQAGVREWVRDENDYERKKIQGLRDEAIVALQKIKEAANG